MPCVVLPSGLLQKMHVRYTARRKLGLLASAKHVMEEEGLTLHRAAKRLQHSASLLVKWQQQQADNDDPILAKLKSKRKATCAGPLGQLKPLKDTLLRYIFKQHEQEITAQMFDLIIKASSLSPEFDAKHLVAKCSAVKRFVHANSIVYRMGMHVTQCRPEDVANEALDFMNLMCPFLDGPHCNRHFIFNMDQSQFTSA